MLELTPLIPALPLAGSALIACCGRRLPGQGAYPAIATLAAGWLISAGILWQSLARGAHAPHWERSIIWAPTGDYVLRMGLALDGLGLAMLLVVTTVSLLVHIYSVGYMHGDPRYPRFFSFLQLFSASMLMLVLADNLLLLYISWELVGLSSYLLIGFWFQKPEAMRAAKKAFIVTRLGDVGLFLGLLTLFNAVGSVAFRDIFAAVERDLATTMVSFTLPLIGKVVWPLAAVAAILIFFGAMGKSAQFPLLVWLPDAMEGPTPVSALIHAATMVAAGVYLVARMYPVFHYTDHGSVALAFVAGVGTVTALMAATIGLVMNDIKRVLAYSTVSQLGYMMMGLGVGGYTAGMFHLFTHAFFKAGLFLGSGSVIHGTGTQDIREMGGLARRMPHTYRTFLLATAALAGIFPFAGFWSKDEILLDAWLHARWVFHAGLAGAVLTAFYMGRLVIKTFLGEPRRPDIHAHESPPVMTVPLWILAFLSVTAGLVNTPWGPLFHHYVSFGDAPAPPFSAGVAAAGTAAALLGLLGAFAVYRWEWVSAATLKRVFHPLYVLFANRWFVDEILYALLVKPLFAVCRAAFAFDRWVVDGLVNLAGWLGLALSRIQGWLDRWVVDGLVNLVGYTVRGTGWLLTRLQTGLAQTNVLLAFAGLAALVWLLVYR